MDEGLEGPEQAQGDNECHRAGHEGGWEGTPHQDGAHSCPPDALARRDCAIQQQGRNHARTTAANTSTPYCLASLEY